MQGTNVLLKVGKNGLTENMIAEIKRQLADSRRVEIEIQKGALFQPDGTLADRKEFAKQIVEKTDANLVNLLGYHLILERKKTKALQPKPVQKS